MLLLATCMPDSQNQGWVPAQQSDWGLSSKQLYLFPYRYRYTRAARDKTISSLRNEVRIELGGDDPSEEIWNPEIIE